MTRVVLGVLIALFAIPASERAVFAEASADAGACGSKKTAGVSTKRTLNRSRERIPRVSGP